VASLSVSPTLENPQPCGRAGELAAVASKAGLLISV
jgi:hypothetical protein